MVLCSGELPRSNLVASVELGPSTVILGLRPSHYTSCCVCRGASQHNLAEYLSDIWLRNMEQCTVSSRSIRFPVSPIDNWQWKQLGDDIVCWQAPPLNGDSILIDQLKAHPTGSSSVASIQSSHQPFPFKFPKLWCWWSSMNHKQCTLSCFTGVYQTAFPLMYKAWCRMETHPGCVSKIWLHLCQWQEHICPLLRTRMSGSVAQWLFMNVGGRLRPRYIFLKLFPLWVLIIRLGLLARTTTKHLHRYETTSGHHTRTTKTLVERKIDACANARDVNGHAISLISEATYTMRMKKVWVGWWHDPIDCVQVPSWKTQHYEDHFAYAFREACVYGRW